MSESAVKKFLFAILLSTVAVGGFAAFAEVQQHEDGLSTSSTAIRHSTAAFKPSPIPAEWVMAGQPVTEVADVSQSQDGGLKVYLWRTTASTFRWVHRSDEIITILDGEVFITDADGTRHHLGVGDVAHFPEGADQVWEVPTRLLKSAILKHRSPRTVEAPLRWMRRLRAFIAG